MAGRPSEYKEEYVQKADQYLLESQDEYDEFHKIRSNSDKSADGYDRLVKVNLPTIEGFSLYLDCAVSSLYEWAKIYPGFSEALSKIKVEQQKRLVNSGLSGDYNPTIAKLILSANHGMRERTDMTSDDKPLTISVSGESASRYDTESSPENHSE